MFFSFKTVSYEEIFRGNFEVGGVKKFLGKKNVSYEEIFPQNFLAQNLLWKNKLELSQPGKFSSPKFPGDKRKFYEEILRSLDNRTEISTSGVPLPSTGWCLLLYVHTTVFSVVLTHASSHTNVAPRALINVRGRTAVLAGMMTDFFCFQSGLVTKGMI